jgi:apurinic endonuclease APN1
MTKIGCHASITPSILDGIKYIESIGGSTIQIFTGSNQSSSLKSKQNLTPETKTEIKTYLQSKDLYLFIHAIYLLNFCAFPPENKRIHYAHQNIIYDLEVGQEIGAKGVVLHIGVQKTMPKEEVYSNMINNIIHILVKTNKSAPDVKLLLETPAGQGTQIATTLPELAELWSGVLNKMREMISTKSMTTTQFNKCQERLGFCLDTAHLFSSGIDLRSRTQVKHYLNQFDKLIGLHNVELIHLNDSKAPLNSRRDIHQGIGDGFIFGKQHLDREKRYLSSLKEIIFYAKKNKVPVVLETHKAGSPKNPNGELYAQEIALLHQLQQGISPLKLKEWRLIHKDTISKKSKKLTSRLGNTKTKKVKNNTVKINTVKGKIDKIAQIASPANVAIINRLKLIQDYYNYIDGDRIRGIAYGRAVLALRNYPEEIMSGDQVRGVKGIGDKIALKINQYLQDGEMKIIKELDIVKKMEDYEMRKKEMITSILGFGPSKVKELKKKGIITVKELRKAFKEGEVDLNNQELVGLTYHTDLSKKIPREITSKIGKEITKLINKSGLTKKYGLLIELAGSYPSGKMESKDIDILLITNNYSSIESMPKKILKEVDEALKERGILVKTLSLGQSKILGIITYGGVVRHLDVRLLPKTSEVAGRLYFTSGREFNQMIRGKAKQLGYKLNEFGLYDAKTGKVVEGLKSEKDIMEKIELNFIPMSKRR